VGHVAAGCERLRRAASPHLVLRLALSVPQIAALAVD
jgi:hypothetical protein